MSTEEDQTLRREGSGSSENAEEGQCTSQRENLLEDSIYLKFRKIQTVLTVQPSLKGGVGQRLPGVAGPITVS